MSKISAKNVLIIIKTCSASGGSVPDPRLCPPNPPPGALPLDSAGGLSVLQTT